MPGRNPVQQCWHLVQHQGRREQCRKGWLERYLEQRQAGARDKASHSPITSPQNRSRGQYVDSNVAEELLFNIPFTRNVKLKSILIVGGVAGMHPSKVRMFKNWRQMTFRDVRATPEQEFQLQPDASGNFEYPVRAVRFSSVHHLSLHFPSNFGSDTTRVYYIGLHGEFTQAQRQGVVLCRYESAANPADHKVQHLQRANLLIQ
ncbi:hypothetical protein MRX96_030222 [Rhipicephalus microplus]